MRLRAPQADPRIDAYVIDQGFFSSGSLRFQLILQTLTMRPLTEEESKAVFTKLANYIVPVVFPAFHIPLLILLAGQKPRSPH